jgi:hypothetical protein
MRAADAAIIALLEATGIDVNDSFVDADNSTNVVTHPLPYLVYESSVGDDDNDAVKRLSGPGDKLSHFFSLAYIGEDPNQARWAGEKARAALRRVRLTGTGIHKSGFVHLDESQRVRRDDDAIRPDGTPLYRGVDLYSVVVTPEELVS